MLRALRFDQIASGLAGVVAAVMGPTVRAWGQGGAPADPTSPLATSGNPTAANGSVALPVIVFAAIVAVIVVAGWYVARRQTRREEAAILQARLSDAIAREIPLRGLVITAKAQAPVWRRSPVTIWVTGEVPTPDLRETAMQVVRAEALRIQPDLIVEDVLHIVPQMHRAS